MLQRLNVAPEEVFSPLRSQESQYQMGRGNMFAGCLTLFIWFCLLLEKGLALATTDLKCRDCPSF